MQFLTWTLSRKHIYNLIHKDKLTKLLNGTPEPNKTLWAMVS